MQFVQLMDAFFKSSSRDFLPNGAVAGAIWQAVRARNYQRFFPRPQHSKISLWERPAWGIECRRQNELL